MRRRRVYGSDANSKELDARFKAFGASVWPLERPFDRLIGYRGRNILVEYKNRETSYGRAGLSKSQRAFAETWRGAPVELCESVDDVPRVLGLVSNRVTGT